MLACPIKSRLQCNQHGEETKDGGFGVTHAGYISLGTTRARPRAKLVPLVLPEMCRFCLTLLVFGAIWKWRAVMAGTTAAFAKGCASASPTR